MTRSELAYAFNIWTNAAYALAAFALYGHSLPFSVVLYTGVGVSVGSTMYHAYQTRRSQRIDVATMMTYLVSAAVVVAVETLPFVGEALYVLVPVAAAYYSIYTWEISSRRHLPAWAAVALGILAFHALWWTLIPLGLLLLGAYFNLYYGHQTLLHSAWHVLTAASVGSALFLAVH